MRTLEPRSIKQLLRDNGVPLGGAIRADVAKALDEGLFQLWESHVAQDGAELAAVILFAWCSRDPSFTVPHWLALAFRRHRAAIFDAVEKGTVGEIADGLGQSR